MNSRAARVGFELLETLVLTVVVFLAIQTFVAQPYKVEGPSMEPTLASDQYVLIDKLTPRFDPYKRGDIVVLPNPEMELGSGAPFIKRVIGVPGDTVELRDGDVYVNGAKLDEPYVYELQATDVMPGRPSTWIVGPGTLIVFGDHRQVSNDSRVFGPISASGVIGRAWLRYWPPETFGVLRLPASATGGATAP